MTKMVAMPIYGKNLQKSSSPEPIDGWPWNLVCSIGYLSNQDCSNDDLRVTLTILQQDQIWENANTYDFMESFEDFGIKMVIRVVLISK